MKRTDKHHLLLAGTSGPSQLEDRSAWDGLWVLETLSQKNLVRSALPHHRSSAIHVTETTKDLRKLWS